MDQSARFCRFCGSPLLNDSKYCENCGAPLTPTPPLSAEQPLSTQEAHPMAYSLGVEPGSPPQSQPPSPPPVFKNPSPQPTRNKKPNTCLVILGLIGLGLICLSLLFVAVNYTGGDPLNALLDLLMGKREAPVGLIQDENNPPTLTAPIATPSAMPTPTPIPNYGYMPLVMSNWEFHQIEMTPYPSLEQSPAEPIRRVGISDNMIFDNFSSTELDWARSNSNISAYDYFHDMYYIHVKQPSYISWSEIPVDFSPNEIEFDVLAPPDNTGGSFGVMCQIQDEINYYSIEIDLSNQVFSIAMVLNDALVPLTNPEWLNLTGMVTTEGSFNHLAISCYPKRITLSVNYVLLGQSDFTGIKPIKIPGKMALFVATWENVGAEGYQVYFDNVTAWIPK